MAYVNGIGGWAVGRVIAEQLCSKDNMGKPEAIRTISQSRRPTKSNERIIGVSFSVKQSS
jgi:hypothetical protein